MIAWWKARQRRALRHMMRGARRMRDTGQPSYVEAAQHAILEERAGGWTPNSFMRRLFWGHINSETIRLALTQYIFIRVAMTYLGPALLRGAGYFGSAKPRAITAPLPLFLVNALQRAGYSTHGIRSITLWYGYALLFWCYGLLTATKVLLRAVRNFRWKEPSFQQSDSYFVQLSENMLPTPAGNIQEPNTRFTLGNWMLQHPDLGDSKFLHSIKSAADGPQWAYQPGPLPTLIGAKACFLFVAWLALAVPTALLAALLGKWQHAFLFHELVQAKVIQLSSRENLPKRYLFHNSNMQFRPLWTYAAEDKACEIWMYLYSSNFQGFQRHDRSLAPKPEYAIMTWPKYLIWDKHQDQFLRRVIHPEIKTKIVGPIWFVDGPTPVPNRHSHLALAYFDVQPVRQSYYDSLGIAFNFYTVENAVRDMSALCGTAKALGAQVLYKRKRDLGKTVHPRFLSLLRNPKVCDVLVRVDPTTAANRVIETSDAVISTPFTSTALIARQMGKPSCYLDLSRSLHPDDPGADGIPILQSRKELEEWINQYVGDAPAALQQP